MTRYIAGFSGLLSDGEGGTKAIADRIPGCEHYRHHEWPEVLEHIKDLHQQGGLDYICLFGHSMGAEAVLEIADELKKLNIKLRYAGIIDLTLGPTTRAGNNIDLLQEFWAAYNKVSFKGFKGSHDFNNLDKILGRNVGHSGAARAPYTQNKIVSTITQIMEGADVENTDDEVKQWTHLNFDRKKFFDHIRESLFGKLGQKQVEGTERLLDIWEKHFVHWDMRELAYNLGTAFHETATKMQPILEYGDKAYFSKYEPGTRLGKVLGNTQPGDGARFKGAGDVQNTGRRNAQKATDQLNLLFNLNIDLVKNPDNRLDPLISGLSLFQGNHDGWWTGRRLPNFAGYGNWNMKGARSVVNGSDRWELIGDYAGHFLEALKVSAVPVTVDVPKQPLPPVDGSIPNLGHIIEYLELNYPELEKRDRAIVLATVDLLKPPDETTKIINQPNPSSEAGFSLPQTKGRGMLTKTLNFKSKTVLTGIFSVLAGLAMFVFPEGNMILDLARSIYPQADPGTLITGGLAIIFAREAIAKNGNGS